MPPGETLNCKCEYAISPSVFRKIRNRSMWDVLFLCNEENLPYYWCLKYKRLQILFLVRSTGSGKHNYSIYLDLFFSSEKNKISCVSILIFLSVYMYLSSYLSSFNPKYCCYSGDIQKEPTKVKFLFLSYCAIFFSGFSKIWLKYLNGRKIWWQVTHSSSIHSYGIW